MICVYLDESGIHDPATGKLRRLALAGCLAREVDWLRFNLEWSPILKGHSIGCFHMVDFEAYRGAFAGWNRSRHETFLMQLLDCFDPHVKSIFGASSQIADTAERLKVSYLNNIHRTINNAFREARFWAFPDEKVSVMFAKHPEVSPVHIEQYVTAIGDSIPNLDNISFGDPKDVVPLQAADLVAYEIARFIPHQDVRKMRYPMGRIWSSTGMLVGPEDPAAVKRAGAASTHEGDSCRARTPQSSRTQS